MYKLIAFTTVIISAITLTGCSANLEDEIVGKWEAVEVNGIDCDTGVTDIEDTVSFDEDGMVTGIKEFQEYKIKETDNDDYDYAVLSGDYKDNTRFRVKITDDDILKIVEEDGDTLDFDSAKACRMKKVDD